MKIRLTYFLTLFVLMIGSKYCVAQIELAPHYTFSQSSGTYSAISGGTQLGSGSSLNSQNYKIAAPFPISVNGVYYDSMYVSVKGHLTFLANTGSSYWIIQSSSTGFAAIAGFSANLTGTSTAEIRYDVVGTSPNRELVVQWSNFRHSATAALNTNFQIRILETTSVIKVVFGSVSVSNSSILDVQVGLRGTTNSYFNCRSTNWSPSSFGSNNYSAISVASFSAPSSGLTYTWTPPICSSPTGQPTNLSFTPNYTSVSGSFTHPSPRADKYLVVRTNGDTLLNTVPTDGVYYTSGNQLGNGTVVSSSSSSSFNATGLTQLTTYRFTVFGFNDTCINQPKYRIASPLTDTVITRGPRAYTWQPTSGTASWTDANNWFPPRTSTDNSDTLYFNKGGDVYITNIPSFTADIIDITNNTNIRFGSNGTKTITIDKRFLLDTGCRLTVDTSFNLKFSTTGGGKPATISGTLVLKGNSSFDFYRSSMIVYGTVIDSGIGNGFYSSCTNNCFPITFGPNSLYIHARNGGEIPWANYDATSTILVTGVKNTVPAIKDNMDVGNFTWDCPDQNTSMLVYQSSSGNYRGSIDTVKGNLRIANTGTGLIRIPAYSGGQLTILGDFIQTGGKYVISGNGYCYCELLVLGNTIMSGGTTELDGTSGYTDDIVYIRGNLTQEAGHTFMRQSSSHEPYIVFDGESSQAVTVDGSFGTLGISYRLENTAGATLTGHIPIMPGSRNYIYKGAWTGSGSFTYSDSATRLIYNIPTSRQATATEWPADSAPDSILIDMRGYEPANRLSLPGNRTIKKKLKLLNGILALNDYDLTIDTAGILTVVGYDSTTMIAANGNGYLVQYIKPIANQVYTYPLGDITNTSEVSRAFLTMHTNSAGRYIGVRVKNGKHPNNTASTDYLARYWGFKDDGGSAYTYSLKLQHQLADINGTLNYRMAKWNGISWTSVNSLVYTGVYTASKQGGFLESVDTLSSTTFALNNNDFTSGSVSANTYTWTGATDNDFQKTTNWTPNRTTPDMGDRLVFSNGMVDTVENIPNQLITRLSVINNTTVCMRAATGGSKTLILSPDSDALTKELRIDSGSNVYLDGTVAALTLSFSGAAANISGRLEVVNTTVANVVNFTGANATVTTSGILAAGTTNNGVAIVCDSNNLLIQGLYEHKYTTVGGALPTAQWDTTSTALIKGYTTATTGLVLNHRLHNVTWDCPNQTSSLCSFGGNNSYCRISGTFKVDSTGTGSLGLGVSNFDVNNFVQTKGLIHGWGTTRMNVSGTFDQQNGRFIFGVTPASSAQLILTFNGVNGRQQVNFHDSSIYKKASYRIVNDSGIHLTGTGLLTDTFTIYKDSKIVIACPGTQLHPITSNLTIKYEEQAYLAFEGPYDYICDSILLPVTQRPTFLEVNMDGNHKLKLPPGTQSFWRVTLTHSHLDMGADTLYITAPSGPGTIERIGSGNVMVTTGAIKRKIQYFYTTTDPVFNLFPIAYGNERRHVYVYYGSSSGNSPGTVTVSFNNIPGDTSGLSINDNGYAVKSRTKSHWSFSTGNGFALSSSGVTIMAETTGLLPFNSAADIRMVKDTNAVGIHATYAGSSAANYGLRKNLTLTEFTSGGFYVSVDTVNTLNADFVSVKSGRWADSSTWNKGYPPTAGSVVFITNIDTVVCDGNSHVDSVIVYGVLRSTDSILQVDSSIVNNGIFEMAGGTVTLGPSGGGKVPFISNGTLNVDSGNLNINGRISLESGSVFNQYGGTIRIDGNANKVVSKSVPANTGLFYLGTKDVKFEGGNLMFVDPPQGYLFTRNSLYTNYFTTCDSSHTLILGDGVSTTAGFTSAGFDFGWTKANGSTPRAPLIRFGNVVVNGSPSGNFRRVNLYTNFRMNNDLTIHTKGELSLNNQDMYIGGHIHVDSGGSFFTKGLIWMRNPGLPNNGGMGSSLKVQYITGTGLYQNDTTNATANFDEIWVTNSNFEYPVVFDKGDVSVTLLSISDGKVITANGSVLYGKVSGASQANGWIVGKAGQRLMTGVSYYSRYDIGDSTYYTPVTLTLSGNTGTGRIVIGVKNTDHPAIGSSIVNSSRSANLYYTIDTIGNIGFGNGTHALFNFNYAHLDPYANAPVFEAIARRNNTWKTRKVLEADKLKIGVSLDSNFVEGEYQFGEVGVAPLIVQQPTARITCSGTMIDFSVSSNYAYGYQWQVNTGSGWSDVNNDTTYTGVKNATLWIKAWLPMNGYKYRCLISNSYDTVATDSALLSVNVSAAPTIVINPNPNDTICAGTSVTFTAAITNGGNAPTYQWRRNGTPVGSNNNTYTNSSLANGDVISCRLTSNLGCAVPDTVTSSVTMTVTPVAAPSLTISPSPNDTICAGTSVTFTATPVLGGTAPSYQWILNGNNVGANSATYVNSSLGNNDIVRCIMTSNETCRTADTASARDTMTVNPLLTPSLTILPNPNDTICTGTSVTYTATPVNGGSTPSYQWKVNGTNVGTGVNYTSSSFNNNDVISCIITSSETCVTTGTANAADTVAVISSLIPAVTISSGIGDTVCAGASVVFTASPVNGGSAPAYQWRLNGSNVGTNSATYTNSGLSNGDVVKCVMTSSFSCANPDTAVSNNIVMVVQPVLTPLVSIAPSPDDTICAGTSVTFTATPVNGGAAPAYQWKLNGSNVGTNSATYANAGFSNNDIVSCIMTSSYACPATATVAAADTMVVIPVLTPTLSIAPNPNDTICAGTSVTFTASPSNGGSTPAYQWKLNGTNVGTNSSTYTNAVLSNNNIVSCVMTSSYACPSVSTATAADTMTVNPVVTTSITITPNPNDTICAGTSVTYTAVANNGGTSPVYQWKLNGSNVGTNSNTYTNGGFSNNDIVSCEVTSSITCPSSPTVIASDTLVVNPNVTPMLAISPNPNDTVCAGTSVTFTATPTNGGTAPTYQWKLNGSNVGTGSSYTNSSFSNNDIVSCVLTSNQFCRTTDTATAADTMVTTALVTPVVTIAVSPGNTICAGTSTTFTATPVNGGLPVYQWKVNGSNVGTNSSTYVSSSLSDNDVVTCVMSSNVACVTQSADTSNSITMTVNPMVTPVVTISVSPNSTICAGATATFTASPINGGTSPVYQWKLNGGNVGTNSATYANGSLANGDVVNCVMSISSSCATKSADTSNDITMTVNQLVTPSVTVSVSPNDTVCAGTPVAFTATPVNGGSSPAYQWKRNGANVGTNNTTYTGTMINNDVINCVMTSSIACVSQSMDTSNNITMTVNPLITPSLTVSVSPDDTICAGTVVTFTATAANGGSTPSYQWKLNGANVGTNSNTYSGSSFNNGNVITCELTSNATCATPATVTGNNVTMTVIPLVIPSVSVTTAQGVVVGPWTPITFTATPVNGGVAPTYQWKRNGIDIVGANNNIYSGSTNVEFVDGDVICVLMTSNATCPSPDTVSDCASPIQVNLSIDNVSQKHWRIYPNPNSGRFSIEIPDAVAGGQLSITDMAGKTVKRITFQPSDQLEFVIGDLADGVYIISLMNGDDIYKGTITISR